MIQVFVHNVHTVKLYCTDKKKHFYVYESALLKKFWQISLYVTDDTIGKLNVIISFVK